MTGSAIEGRITSGLARAQPEAVVDRAIQNLEL
jgi:hypothetical protein